MPASPITVVDISHLEIAIVQLLNDAIFGVGTFPNPAILTNATLNNTVLPIRIYRGWPSDDRLQTDLKAGGVNVSVYQMAVGRNATRFQRDWETYSTANTTVALAVSGSSVTVSGSGSAANIVGIAYGPHAGSYRPTAGELANSVATNLANAVAGCTAAGSVITVPTNGPITARVVGDVTLLQETARQSQRFLISIWAPSSTVRDLVGTVVHGAMARAISLQLPYGVTTEALIPRGSSNPQMDEKVGVFRRDEPWETEFPTIDMIVDPAVLFVKPQLGSILITVI